MGMDLHEAREFAKEMTVATQGAYNRGNRPEWFRGPVGSTVMLFNTFKVIYLELMIRLPWRARLVMLGVLLLAAGIRGFPFYKNIDDIVTAFNQLFQGGAKSMDHNIEKTLTQAGKAVLGETGGKIASRFAMDGLSSILPFDFSARTGVGEVIPGTGALRPDSPNKLKEASKILGVAGGMIADAVEALSKFAEGHLKEAGYKIAPAGVASYAKGAEYAWTGKSSDTHGGKVLDVTIADALWRMIGFNPSGIKEESAAVRETMQRETLAQVRKEQFVQRYLEAEALMPDKKAAKEAAAKVDRDVDAWNRENPDYEIQITNKLLKSRQERLETTREERMIKRAPKSMREGVERRFKESKRP